MSIAIVLPFVKRFSDYHEIGLLGDMFIRPSDNDKKYESVIGLRNGEILMVPIQVSEVIKKFEKLLTEK